ncbi:hypothetical protein SynNOUM97013_00976 [Synechococcus sp. NOUM97013]|nr:hypothetical protein SynNOUM97013_00976 [Synechococcus sp. NOUM97013]
MNEALLAIQGRFQASIKDFLVPKVEKHANTHLCKKCEGREPNTFMRRQDL